MYSASEQNERDVTSVAERDINENKSDEHNKYKIPRPFEIQEQNFDKDHKKSNFRQQTCGAKVSPRPVVEQYAPYRKSTGYLETHTYTVQHSTEDKSARNDRDTDCEISELTDLPTELDEKSPRRYLSPGEDKATSPLSSSRSTKASTDFGSLSEGELPGFTIPRRLSEGEKPVGDISPHGQQQTSAEKMETALQAISEELAKCKQLLLHQRKQREVPDPHTKVDS